MRLVKEHLTSLKIHFCELIKIVVPGETYIVIMITKINK